MKAADVTVDEMNRIMVEVGTGKEPAKPDTPDMARLRREFAAAHEKARTGGKAIQIPNE